MEMNLLQLVEYAVFLGGPVIVLGWFLIKVRPKFPSLLPLGIVGFLALLSFLTVNLILNFAIAPLSQLLNPSKDYSFSLGYAFQISLLEESVKFFSAVIGILLVREETRWTDVKLSMAFVAGLVFGMFEWVNHVLVLNLSGIRVFVELLSRLTHPIMTVGIMAGVLLLLNRKRVAGFLVLLYPFLGHALLDYFITHEETLMEIVVGFLLLLDFVAGVYLLLPVISSEKERRRKFESESKASLGDNWIMKLEQ